jgi:hypothetical protein
VEPRARPTANHDDLAEPWVKCLDRSLRTTLSFSLFIPIEERGGQNLSPYQIRLLRRSRGVLGHIEPNLKNVASRHTVVQDDPSKYRFPIPDYHAEARAKWPIERSGDIREPEKLHGAF